MCNYCNMCKKILNENRINNDAIYDISVNPGRIYTIQLKFFHNLNILSPYASPDINTKKRIYDLLLDYPYTYHCYNTYALHILNKQKNKLISDNSEVEPALASLILILYRFFGEPNASDNKLKQLPIKNIAEENLLNDEEKKLIEAQIINTLPKNIKNTEKKTIINSRIGQENFRKQLIKCYGKCVLCDIKHESILKASHIKPWSDSNNTERLDFFNGFLLCANHDALFDKGLISFDDDGHLLMSNNLDESTKKLLNLSSKIKINIFKQHKKYLKWHREHIFIK
ncbi:HNH endonuclease [Clostridium novyi]